MPPQPPACPPAHPFRRAPGAGPILIAHGGAPSRFPENTLASFGAALQAHAAIIEMDVRTTRDNELVVFHDASIRRMSGKSGQVAQMTLRQIQSLALLGTPQDALHHAPNTCRVPRLKDVLAAFPHAAMNIDLKAVSAKHVPQVFHWIREQRANTGPSLQVLLTSAHATTQAAIVSHNAHQDVYLGMGQRDVIRVLHSAWRGRPPIKELVGRACQMPAHWAVFGRNIPLLSSRLRGYLQAMQCPLHVWWNQQTMVNETRQLRICDVWQVDGVFTDHIGEPAFKPNGPHRPMAL